MRIFIFTFILFVSNCCLAQNWAANNTVWHYEQINIQPPFDEDYNKFSTIGDTVILGEPSKIILEERITLNDTIANEIFMKSDSNRVYLYDSFSNSFKLLYDFGALPGDTIEVFTRDEFSPTTTIVVDSVSIININGTILGVQHVSQTAFGNYDMSGIIIENIGWTGFMFPLHTLADPPYGGELRCFQNDSIGLYKPSAVNCDYITGTESFKINHNFNIYPNPANETLHVSIDKNIKLTKTQLSIINISGSIMLKESILTHNTELNINQLPNGIYFLKIDVNNEKSLLKKISIIR